MIMQRIIWSLDLDINEVVYLRRDGKVIGAKYLGFSSQANGYGNVIYHKFYRADGEAEVISISCGYINEKPKGVYATIEDAIHDVEPIRYRKVNITNLMIELFGFSYERNCIGGLYLGKHVWKWDGYKPKKVHVHQWDYKITWDGEWTCKYNGKNKYYATEEECRCDNHVDVVTF